MAKRTYAILGATGHVGSALAAELLKRGHDVRAIGRDKAKLDGLTKLGATPHPAPFDNATALAEAFRGAAGVFTLVPPSYDADDFSAYQDRVGTAIVDGLKKAGTTHLVDLSSIGAQHPDGTGPIAGLYRQEKRLEGVKGLNVLHLRPAYFMENLFFTIPVIKQQGIAGSPIRADLAIPMVATKDIGAKAADLLDRLEFRGSGVLEFVGPKAVTMNEAAATLGKAIGKPGLKYVQFPYEDARKAMLGMGMKPSITGLMIEMQKGFNEGRVAATQTPVQGTTTLEEFSKAFAEAYRRS